MSIEKKTKAMYFAELKNIVENTSFEDLSMKEELVEFIDKSIETLARRREAAAKRAAEKRNESDELTETIYRVLSNDFMTLDEVVAAVNDETVTRNKVSARLGKLVKNEKVEKETIKTESGKKMAYRVAA